VAKSKNPWLAAFLNFIFPGLGYIYSGTKRPLFAWGLFVLSIWVGFHDWNEITGILTGKLGLTEHFILFIILYPLVFAYDAYRDLKEMHR